MRLLCVMHGGCWGDVIREEWLVPDMTHRTVRLLRFHECRYCHKTWATMTSPEVEETRYSEPHHSLQYVRQK